jgi:hypothetical protein
MIITPPAGAEKFLRMKTFEPQQQAVMEAPPCRDNLLVSAWLKLDLPLRDFLLGEVFSTTTRCLIIGETGIGKTLL